MRAVSPGHRRGRKDVGLAGEGGCPLETEKERSEGKGRPGVAGVLEAEEERVSRKKGRSVQCSSLRKLLDRQSRPLRPSAWTLPVSPGVLLRPK